MKAFRVLVNGKPLCTAGVGRDGVLFAKVNWLGTPDEVPASDFWLSVGGIDGAQDEFLEWILTRVELGDEITIQVVEVDQPDAPESRRSRDEVVSGMGRHARKQVSEGRCPTDPQPMKALRVRVNGKHLCTAGVGEEGVLTAAVNWLGLPEQVPDFQFRLSVGGLDGAGNHFQWPTTRIDVGDEITIHLVEVDQPDRPTNRRRVKR